MLKRQTIVSAVIALCFCNLLQASALRPEKDSLESADQTLSEHDQEGLIWRLTIHQPEEETFHFLEEEAEEPKEIDALATGHEHKIPRRRNGKPTYRTHDNLAVNDLFTDMHVALPQSPERFKGEAQMPDSFLSKASASLANEPQFTEQVRESRKGSRVQNFNRVAPARKASVSSPTHYTRNIAPITYTRSLQLAPPAPNFEPVRAESVYIRYPETPGLKSRLTATSTQASVPSRTPHGISSSFYALQNPLTPGESVSLAAATRGEDGAFTVAAGNVVMDSNMAWNAVRARPGPTGGLSETEDWDSSNASNPNAERGWETRDGEMTAGYDAFGNGNPGSIKGTFDSQFFPFPETDAFTALASDTDEEDKFLGDYSTINYWNGWTFDFYAEDVIPSDLIFRFSDGINTFYKSFASQVTTVGAWHTIRIYPGYNTGWIGGSQYDFEQTLTSVDQIDIQITRNGIDEQSYYVDNFSYKGNAVPEPDTAMFFVFGCAVLTLRQKLNRREKLKRRG